MATTKHPVTIKLDNMREFRRDLKALGDDAINDLKAVHTANANIVAGTARVLVPKRTGRLAGTIRGAGTKTGGRVRAGFKAVPYAGPIHFGWADRGIKPQPFLYDALDRRRNEVAQNYAQQLENLKRKHKL
jgi:hypothetical protein